MKKICVVTSTRADYGLLTGIMYLLKKDSTVDLRVVATGTHLEKKYGYTLDYIKKDGFNPISINLDLRGDRATSILRTMGNALVKFSSYFHHQKPDLLIILGDRFEIFSVAQAALVSCIPVAHIHGGEISEGAIDDSMRHSITKISSLHFTSNERYKKRIIQLGEPPQLVFNFGAPGLDNILNLKLISRFELEKELNIKFNKKNILVTFHPVTTSEEVTIKETMNFFNALELLGEEVSLFVTMPNADTYSHNIIQIVERLKRSCPERFYVFQNLGQLRYLSMMREVDVVAGNSSSGIIEAPFMNKAVVNVGIRQKGRMTSEHVIHTSGGTNDILNSIEVALSDDFKCNLKGGSLLYGDGKSSERIVNEILQQDLKKLLPKKFYDLEDRYE